ncbi:MAG: MBL fold metallo-hydrolase [Cytophagaceae bacterium]|jgi:L-ascorbate metabolism protein UlaG (beta-lactamase superfamily)|nr:MBL fold metallo-hydrolase [Cytophagaceae bacterium]
MKKNVITAGVLLLAIVIGIISISAMTAEKEIKRICNPNLPIVKEGWTGNIVIDGRFQYDTVPRNTPFVNAFKWMLSRNPQRHEKRSDTFRAPVQPFNPSALSNNSLVWLGHSSFLLNINGIRLLTDPCFFALAANRRMAALPCSTDSLTNIDFLLVSHDHRDHFDKKSAKILTRNNPHMEVLLPLGGNRLFQSRALRSIKTQEAGWYQEYSLNSDIRIIFLPARHWGRRGLNDENKTLWGGFIIIAGDTKIFFAGDTAYDSHLFNEIKELFGSTDVCLFPIGAYSPQWMMTASHTTPEEAVQAFADLGAKTMIPMHYGTYDLSDEPAGEPLRRLYKCSADAGIHNNVKVLEVGEVFQLN